MSHTTSVSARLAWSLVAALTSPDGWQAFTLGLRRLPRVNPFRHVSCINLVAESLAVRTQMPSWDGVDCEFPRFAVRSDAQARPALGDRPEGRSSACRRWRYGRERPSWPGELVAAAAAAAQQKEVSSR